MAQWGSIPHLLQSVKINPRRRKWLNRQRGTILILYRKDMENFNKLVPIDGENGEKRTISSLQIAEITGKAYCGVLKVIRKMDIMRVKITMKNIFSLFVCLKNCCTFVVLQLTIKYANGIFYARKETYILKYRQTISVYHRPMAMVGCSKLGYLSAFLFNNK